MNEVWKKQKEIINEYKLSLRKMNIRQLFDEWKKQTALLRKK